MQGNTAGTKAIVTRRTWLACAACFTIALAEPRVSRAGESSRKKPATRAAPKTHYLVSAILREGVKDFTFRLVHSAQSASSVDEAIGIFTRLVMDKHPGYAIAQTTVTDITWPPDICATNKAIDPRRPEKTFYAVSAVLGNSSNDLDTLLVNGWLPGNSADEALNRVLRDITAKYPDFTPVSKLVMQLDPSLAGCPAPGPATSPARYHGERV